MKSVRLLLLFSAIAVCGCAQMAVDVSILDRRFWSSPEQLGNAISDQVANMIRKRGNGEFDAARERLKARSHDTLVELSKPICTDTATQKLMGCVDPQFVETLYAEFTKSIDNAFADADTSFNQAFLSLARASSASSLDTRTTILFEAQRQLDKGYSTLRRLQDEVSAQIRRQIATLATAKALETAKKAEAQVQQAVLGLIGDRGILDDPLASSVVYAGESFWRRTDPPSGINNTYVTGTFGNTDIAIKMESVGNFTIKGVRLDASKITQATFAVGRQAIKTVAAIYGLPTLSGDSKATATTPTSPFAETSIGFASPDRRRGVAEETLLRRRLARVSIIETIIIQRDALINPATDTAAESARAAAIKTVKDTYTANKSDLDPPAPTK